MVYALTMMIPSIPDVDGFDWSRGNDKKIESKHGVKPLEVEQVFFNMPILTYSDDKHSVNEERLYVLGVTDAGRRLFVAFTIRNRMIRPISARNMSRRERRMYKQ